MRGTRPALTAHGTFARALAGCALAILAATSCGSDSTAVVAATALRFFAQPTNVAAGETFSVTVELVGAAGTRANGATDPVALSVLGGVALAGPSSVAASDGVAKFDGLSMTLAGTNLQFVATSGLLSTTSATFAVTPGAADLPHSGVSPAPGNIAPNVTTALTFTFKDAYGNPIPSATVTVTSSLAAATFTPSSGTTSTSGTFATNFKSTVEGSATVTATVGGKALVFTPAFVVVDLCPPGPMAFPGTVNGTLGASTGCVVSGRASAVYRFTTATAVGAAFSVTSAFQPLFEVKKDAASENIAFTTQEPTATEEWLLPAGTYLFRIGALASSGTFSVTGAVVPANTGCFFDTEVFRSLIVSGTYSGQMLETGDCFFEDGSFFDAFFVFSTLPCTVTLRSPAFNAGLYVYASEQTGFTFVDGADNVGVGADATVSLTSCSSGPNGLMFLTNSFTGGESGPYTLTFTLQGGASLHAGASSSGTSHPQVVRSAGDVVRLLKARAVPRKPR